MLSLVEHEKVLKTWGLVKFEVIGEPHSGKLGFMTNTSENERNDPRNNSENQAKYASYLTFSMFWVFSPHDKVSIFSTVFKNIERYTKTIFPKIYD